MYFESNSNVQDVIDCIMLSAANCIIIFPVLLLQCHVFGVVN